ncbi:carbohydrate ABC transporter permease [Ruthenibacterium sp. CLA-JM-H11]|uniref:Carbohydrate ABC transporter permease n=1 Tax=Ruthenibacterium intestinale TaxID=3133163 RepID=A0ABV1GBH1_9FIRM
MNLDKLKRILILCVKYLVSAVIIAVVIGPLLVTLFTSVKTQVQLGNTSAILPPALGEWTWDNYAEVLGAKLLPDAFKNTGIILVISIFFNVLFGSVTAYCLQRFEFRFKKLIMGCFYLGMMVPTFVVEIARFKVIQSIGLYNTLGAPIIIYVASDLMQLYLYMQFVSKIPKALDESALIDGCGYFRIFYRIIFPLLMPATATVIIIKIVNIVNDMYVPYLYMPKTKLKTLTTFLMNYAGAQQGSWPTLAAAIVVVLIPTVVLYLIFHKQITEGLSAGATKE